MSLPPTQKFCRYTADVTLQAAHSNIAKLLIIGTNSIFSLTYVLTNSPIFTLIGTSLKSLNSIQLVILSQNISSPKFSQISFSVLYLYVKFLFASAL